MVLPRGSHTHGRGDRHPGRAAGHRGRRQSVVLRLAADIDVSRGDLLAATDAPPAPCAM